MSPFDFLVRYAPRDPVALGRFIHDLGVLLREAEQRERRRLTTDLAYFERASDETAREIQQARS